LNGPLHPLLSAPTNVALFKQKDALSLEHANAYSCPEGDFRSTAV
jgi:hypothetical protein